MIRVAALTSGERVPSARFRVRQFIALLQDRGVTVSEYVSPVDQDRAAPRRLRGTAGSLLLRGEAWCISGAKILGRVPGLVSSWKTQAVWLERGLFSGRLTLERLLPSPLAFDVDDAIWLRGRSAERAAQRIASQARVVLAGNRYLAEWFAQHASDVRVVPTAVDVSRFRPASAPRPSSRFTIVWTGLGRNLAYVARVQAPLADFLHRRDAELLVISDVPPDLPAIRSANLRFCLWTPAVEAEAVRDANVGIMPLQFGEWERGKCGFKMLQYMASGLPVVVTPVGVNAEILEMDSVGYGAASDEEWVEALERLHDHSDQAAAMGAAGRRLVERKFSTEVVADQIAAVFRSIVD
jgi:glycosyltransferase involved in cell wall biosynthesis